MNRNAVIVRAGRKSKHRKWVREEAPKFDLIILPYEELPSELTVMADVLCPIEGSKVYGWAQFFRKNPTFIDQYDVIALMDDDLVCSASDINKVFRLGKEFKLEIWQPSLTDNSYFTYSVFQRNDLFRLRYVNYIEMMCPFMTSDALKRALPLFDLGYETGIDRLWCRLIDQTDKAYAVFDSVSFYHTRSVGENSAAQGFTGQSDGYQAVLEEMESLLEISYPGTVAYAGVSKSGRLIENRLIMAVLSLVPIKHWNDNPTPRFIKRFLISFKHNLTRSVKSQKLIIEEIDFKLRANR